MMTRYLYLPCASCIVFALGCSQSGEAPGQPTAATETRAATQPAPDEVVASSESGAPGEAAGAGSSEETAPPPEPLPIEVHVGGKEAYQALLQKHRGKVILADFWATWCLPCVKQFPHTVELSKRHAADLAVISVAFEDVDDPEAMGKVLSFLEEKEGHFDNLLSEYGIGVESAVAFEVGCDGAIPFYKLYDRQGKLRYQFCALPEGEEEVSPLTELDAKLQELLAEGR